MSAVATEIPAWVGGYIGLPFKDRGRTRAGVDCWGLVTLVYREVFGIRLPSYEGRYPSARDRVSVARLFFEEATGPRWRRVGLSESRPGDVLTLYLAGERHVGIVVAPNRFLHVMAGRETCVERIEPAWAGRIEAVYRHEALA